MDEEAPARLVEVANLQEHDDIVSTVAASHSHDGLVLSGSHDRRYIECVCSCVCLFSLAVLSKIACRVLLGEISFGC